MIKVTVLGSSGTASARDNPCSGYLYEADGFRMMVDAGPGTLANLQRHCELTDVDAVVLSHAHPDHWLEVPIIRNALRYVYERSGLAVFGTAETLTLAESLHFDGLAPTIDWTVIDSDQQVAVGPFTLRFSQTDHPGQTLGMRITSGASSVGYTADTGPGWSLADLGNDPLDLAFSEATHLHEDVDRGGGVHLTAAQAGSAARAAGVRRLVVTHIAPGGDYDRFQAEASGTFGAPVEVALPHRSYTT